MAAPDELLARAHGNQHMASIRQDWEQEEPAGRATWESKEGAGALGKKKGLKRQRDD